MRQALRVRDPQTVAHSTRLILMVCAAVVGESRCSSSPTPTASSSRFTGSASPCSSPAPSPRVLDRLGISMLSAVFGVFLICTLKLPPEDTSAASQAFFAFPVFWAASHLQAAGVALATANR
jgi:hypothetical protein